MPQAFRIIPTSVSQSPEQEMKEYINMSTKWFNKIETIETDDKDQIWTEIQE